MTELDRRVHAFRPDLADLRLEGQVEADMFTAGEPACVAWPAVGLFRHPAPDAAMESEALRGDRLTVFETTDEGWCWVQLSHDNYVGWMAAAALSAPEDEPTHQVCAARTLVFSGPDIKAPLIEILPLGAVVRVSSTVRDHNAQYGLIAPAGAVVMQHLQPVGKPGMDFVTAAERLIGTPYLWGGCSAFGLDCSGLVQTAMRMSGLAVPRDTDMQESAIGAAVERSSGLQRGDLIFWRGHVGIMLDSSNLLHANAHHMAVAIEPLAEAVSRFEAADLPVSAARRP